MWSFTGNWATWCRPQGAEWRAKAQSFKFNPVLLNVTSVLPRWKCTLIVKFRKMSELKCICVLSLRQPVERWFYFLWPKYPKTVEMETPAFLFLRCKRLDVGCEQAEGKQVSLLYPAGGSTTLMFVYLWLLNNVRPSYHSFSNVIQWDIVLCTVVVSGFIW